MVRKVLNIYKNFFIKNRMITEILGSPPKILKFTHRVRKHTKILCGKKTRKVPCLANNLYLCGGIARFRVPPRIKVGTTEDIIMLVLLGVFFDSKIKEKSYFTRQLSFCLVKQAIHARVYLTGIPVPTVKPMRVSM